jgi:nicotinate-nucleotide pyrophosphorylase (carboxylating)
MAAKADFVEIEVETLDQLQEALDAGARMVLLDNMSLPTLHGGGAHQRRPRHSGNLGGVTLDGLRALAETGVDRISIGT